MTRKLTYILTILMLGFFGCKPDTKIVTTKTETGIKLIYKPKNSVYSGFEIRLIPKQPDFEISENQAELLIDYLSKEFPGKEITARLDSSISFVDCGQGFEKVICPNCGEMISGELWQESMDKAYENDFKDLTFNTNCCQTITDLNSLKYELDCGFAKSMIEVNNPEKEINEQKLLTDLKNLCGIDFKVIYANI